MSASDGFRSFLRPATITVLALVLLCSTRLTAQSDTVKAAAAPAGTPAPAGAPATPVFTEEKIALIEDNLFKDLESGNVGVVIGGTQTVREMKKAVPNHDFSKLIIPLMRIVKDEDADRAERILAALALDEIDSERGNFAISREAEMSSDEIFKALCANLTQAKEAKKPK